MIYWDWNRPTKEQVDDYLLVLHLAEAVPKPTGARSRRRRWAQVREMFREHDRRCRPLHSQPDEGNLE